MSNSDRSCEREFAEHSASEPSAGTSNRRRSWLWGSGLVLLTFAAYWPVLNGGFVWDDTVLIDRNSLVKGEASLLTIWFREDFPLSLVALWLQWLAWGKHAAGYHIVNVLLHAGGAVLFWRVLTRLGVRGAWLGAALFAVHPVAVASAAWISELKNTLSMALFLTAFCFFLRFDAFQAGDSEIRNRKWYWLALGAFLLALLSKTSTVMLPVVLLGCAWWQHRQNNREPSVPVSCCICNKSSSSRNAGGGRRLSRMAPFFALALAFGLMTIWFQKHQVLTDTLLPRESFAQRLAGAGWALWFYLGKALLPLNLAMIYPRWDIHGASRIAWLPLVGWLALLAVCWWFRRGLGRHALFALGCFTALLFPVLGFFDMYFFSIARVSDHFAYLALLPVTALAASIMTHVAALVRARIGGAIARPRQLTSAATALGIAALVFMLAASTMQRAHVFASDESLWRDTLSKNPAAWVAHNNLGCILAEQGKVDEAAKHFEASLQTNPANAEAHRNLGKALALLGRPTSAEAHLRAAVRLNPKDGEAQRTLASTLVDLGKPVEAIAGLRAALRIAPDAGTRIELANALRSSGDAREAIVQLRLAVAAKPDSAEALNNLAWMLATSADASLRRGIEAVGFAERACELTSETNALMVATRAAAYAEAERFDDAVASAQKAIELATAAGTTSFAKLNQQLLRLYRARLPYHERPFNRDSLSR